MGKTITNSTSERVFIEECLRKLTKGKEGHIWYSTGTASDGEEGKQPQHPGHLPRRRQQRSDIPATAAARRHLLYLISPATDLFLRPSHRLSRALPPLTPARLTAAPALLAADSRSACPIVVLGVAEDCGSACRAAFTRRPWCARRCSCLLARVRSSVAVSPVMTRLMLHAPSSPVAALPPWSMLKRVVVAVVEGLVLGAGVCSGLWWLLSRGWCWVPVSVAGWRRRFRAVRGWLT